MIRFLLILSTILAYTVFKAAALWPGHWFAATLSALAVFGLMLGSVLIYRTHHGVFDQPWFRAFSWVGSLVMAVWATFVIFSVPLDLIGIAVPALRAQDISLGVLGASITAAAVGLLMAMLGPRVKRVAVPVHGLHPALRGLKICQLSDLHVGTTIRTRYVDKIVARANACAADIVAVTGDLADADLGSIARHLEPLRNLRAGLGVFYVTGNHEYYWGAQALVEKIASLGLVPLLNENRVIPVGDARLLVAGVTDPAGAQLGAGHRPDIDAAARTDADPQFRILLAHQPDFYERAEALGFDLQLSGHTHAGQFFPFSLFIGFAHKYYRGLDRFKRLWVHVNPGTGYWGPPNRFAVPSEITLLTLTPA